LTGVVAVAVTGSETGDFVAMFATEQPVMTIVQRTNSLQA
jgi:hypothetical protein